MSVTKAQLIGNVPLGSASAPTFTFADDPNTGIYSPGADQLALVTGGTARITIDSSGNVTIANRINVPLGSAAAPSIYFAGDTNTGIYSPGDNQLVISTNGTGRLFFDASGRVGIGADSPSTSLEIASNANSQTEATIPTVRLTNTDTTAVSTDITGSYEFYSLDTSEANVVTGYVRNVAEDAGTKYALVFGSKNAGLGASERLRITSDGKLGLGTSNPATSLHIASSTPQFRLQDTDATNQFSQITQGSGTTYIYNQNGTSYGEIRFQQNNGTTLLTPLVIDSSQRVGIGTTSPGSILHVSNGNDSASGEFIGLTIGGTNVGNARTGSIIKDTTTYDLIYKNQNFSTALGSHVFRNGPSEHARIDSSGRLLVGTSSAYGTAYTTPIQVKASGSLSGGYSIVSANNENAGGFCLNSSSDNSIRIDSDPDNLRASSYIGFNVDATERMRITNDGTHYTRGTTSVFSFASNAAAGTTNWLQLGGHSASSITGYTISYAVYTNGNIVNTNGSYTAISDSKLKENIVDASSQWDDIKAIRIRNWNFKEETGHETHRQIGPIAQELEQVSPGLVFETPDRDEDGNETGEVTKGVNQSILYMKAVKALQEAMERIEVLEQRLTDAGIA